MTVTFCGHAEISQSDSVRSWLTATIETLITNGADTFYLGGYEAFDQLAAVVLRNLKMTYPNIRLILVLAYLNRNTDTKCYDSTLYPALERVPPRFAISKRNERMIDMSDVVVAYVTHGWGGAAKTLEYAKKKRKTLLCFPCRKQSAIS